MDSYTLRDAFASLIGVALAAVVIWLLRDAIIDWKVASGGVIIGLYLALPRRMRVVGETLWGFFKSSKELSDG